MTCCSVATAPTRCPAAAGNDVIVGDNGFIGRKADQHPVPADRRGDAIDAGAGNDIVLAGTGSDAVSGGAGNDLIFGDFGLVYGVIDLTLLPYSSPLSGFAWTSLDAGSADGGDADLLLGGDGDDVLIGGQGADVISAGNGDDDVIGGSTVAGGSDAGDIIDAGAGNDWVIGDNGTLQRTGSRISERFRTPLGDAIYNDLGVAAGHRPVATGPRTRPTKSGWSSSSTIPTTRCPAPTAMT